MRDKMKDKEEVEKLTMFFLELVRTTEEKGMIGCNGIGRFDNPECRKLSIKDFISKEDTQFQYYPDRNKLNPTLGKGGIVFVADDDGCHIGFFLSTKQIDDASENLEVHLKPDTENYTMIVNGTTLAELLCILHGENVASRDMFIETLHINYGCENNIFDSLSKESTIITARDDMMGGIIHIDNQDCCKHMVYLKGWELKN